MWRRGAVGGRVVKTKKQPHAKRRGSLKNNNPPGNFSKAPRCGAKTRKGSPCQAPAMANGRCRMHGGKATGAPKRNQNAFKHGHYTADSLAMRKYLSELLQSSKALLEKM